MILMQNINLQPRRKCPPITEKSWEIEEDSESSPFYNAVDWGALGTKYVIVS